jgi:hypothetical protein
MRDPYPVPDTLKIRDLGQDDIEIRCSQCRAIKFCTGYALSLQLPADMLVIRWIVRHVCQKLAGKSFSQSLEREACGGFEPFLGVHLKKPDSDIHQLSRLDVLPGLEPARLRTRHADRETICGSFDKTLAQALLCIQGTLAIFEQPITCHTDC